MQDCHPVLLRNCTPHGFEICLYVQISQYEVGGINWWIKLGLCINLSRLPPLLSRWKQFSCTLLASLFNHQLVDLFQNSSGCSFTYMQRACQTRRVANSRRMVLYQSLYIFVCPRHSWCDFMFTAPLMDSEAQMGNYGTAEWISLQRPHHLNASDASRKDTANTVSTQDEEIKYSPHKKLTD